MTTIASTRTLDSSRLRPTTTHRASATKKAPAERGPWMAGLLALVVVAFPAVQLVIEAVLLVFEEPRPDLVLALGLSAMATVLFTMPLLVAAAVRRNSKPALLMALLAMLTVVVGSALWSFS